jgi:hypothetical protein
MAFWIQFAQCTPPPLSNAVTRDAVISSIGQFYYAPRFAFAERKWNYGCLEVDLPALGKLNFAWSLSMWIALWREENRLRVSKHG